MSEPPLLLLVDDEVHILKALRRTLAREGYRILLAENGPRALELLEEHPVDLVLCDQRMPGMSGVELLREVGRRRPALARVLLTGWPEEIPDAELLAAGVGALLRKPWDNDELKEVLRQRLGRASG